MSAKLAEALQLGLDAASTVLTERKAALAGYPHKWRIEQESFDKIAAALSLHEAEKQEQAGWQPMESAPKDGSEILVLCDGEMLLVSWRESQGRLYGEWYTGFSCAEDGRYTATDPVLWASPPLQPKEIGHHCPIKA